MNSKLRKPLSEWISPERRARIRQRLAKWVSPQRRVILRRRFAEWYTPHQWAAAVTPRRLALATLDEVVLRTRPIQVTGGFFVGIALGLNPWLTLQGVALIAILVMVRLNWLAVAGGLFLGSTIAFTAQPIFHSVGDLVLTRTPNYFRLWAGLYHAPLLPFTRFHNTVCMGGLVFTVLVGIPATAALHYFIRRNGKMAMAWFRGTMAGEKLAESRLWRQYGKNRSLPR